MEKGKRTNRDSSGTGTPSSPLLKCRKTVTATCAPLIVISDIHGHLDKLIHALNWFVHWSTNNPSDLYTVVLLGDFVDNGPKIDKLLDWLQEAAGHNWIHPHYPNFQLCPILGNHDLACLLSVTDGVFKSKRNMTSAWWNRWKCFWNPGYGTPAAYGVDTHNKFKQTFPHSLLLESLPWYHKEDGYVFVHAGLREGVHSSEQIEYLDRKDLSADKEKWQTYNFDRYSTHYGMPDQLTNKTFATTNDPAWGCIVVTGHNKYLDQKNFTASNRLGLHAGSCEGGPLHCAILPRNIVTMGSERLLHDGVNGTYHFKVFDFRTNEK